MSELFSEIRNMFSYNFMVYALIAGVLTSVCASMLGVGLVLKRYSMIGDGLSHVAFGSLAVATALGAAPLAVTIPIVILAAFLLLRLTDSGKLKGDSATAMLSSVALAVGVMSVSFSGTNIDLNSYLFGSLFSVGSEGVLLSAGLAVLVIPTFIILYNRIFSVTFDSSFARATGIRAGVYDTVIAILTALTIVLGMRFMGTLLISSLIVFPPIISMRLFGSFKRVVIFSSIIPIITVIFGLLLSYYLGTPLGAGIVCVNALFLGLSVIISKIRAR